MSQALTSFLAPLTYYLDSPEVSELCINRPGELWVEKKGDFECIKAPDLTFDRIVQIAQLMAEYNKKTLSETKPLLSATLPTGERCQFVLPPACDKGQVICSIRKPSTHQLTLSDWFSDGLLRLNKKENIHDELIAMHRLGDFQGLLSSAILGKCNIIISGGTSTAKTTFLNSCLQMIPLNERVITIEGVREVSLPHPNVAHLLSNEDQNLTGCSSMLDLLKASLRLRPDRIFLSELRGHEAYPFLRASISGHPGSMTTLHADSIEHARTQLKFMLAESHELQGSTDERLNDIIHTSVDVIVQMSRIEGGIRGPSAIYVKGLPL